jgi:acetyl-CoA carboxylase biotin carboxyl carrier protein
MAAKRPAATDHRAVTELARQLGALLAELGLTEIEVDLGGARVRLARAPAVPAVAPAPLASGAAPVAERAAPVTDVTPTSLITIEAPMVGTFYRAPSPTAEPYVREGDVAKEGQVLCIIEAMKLMNEIESKAGGRIARILVENGQPVEYGQPLFLIEPAG